MAAKLELTVDKYGLLIDRTDPSLNFMRVKCTVCSESKSAPATNMSKKSIEYSLRKLKWSKTSDGWHCPRCAKNRKIEMYNRRNEEY